MFCPCLRLQTTFDIISDWDLNPNSPHSQYLVPLTDVDDKNRVGMVGFEPTMGFLRPVMKVWNNRFCNINYIMVCTTCNHPLSGKQTRFCSAKCKNTCLQSYEAQRQRFENIKKTYVIRAGGSCVICGYDKNLGALSFHHKEPKLKLFKLDARSMANRSSEALEAEYLKCILMCANCHMELHHPRWSNWKT